MEKSKQTEASKRVDDGPDPLSNLPDPILLLILSRLPTTEEAIRTSILSTRWRYLWTSLPSLDLDYSRGSKSVKQFKQHRFTEFVYYVLVNRSHDLDTLRLSCFHHYSMSTIDQWIDVAVTRNVKQLHLSFRPEKEKNIEMPHCLVTCGSLEVLKLCLLGGFLSLPKITGFPSLRVLELNGVELHDDGLINDFFKSCQLFEDLSLIECTLDRVTRLGFHCISCPKLKNLRIDNREMVDYLVCGDLRISCPNLVFLELTGTVAYKLYFDTLDSLKKAVIHPKIPDPDSDSEPERMADYVCKLFAKICHVECLSISISFAAKCIDPQVGVRVSLPNLKTLELTIDCMDTDAVQFIKCFPNLESLYLNIIWDDRLLEYWKLNDDATMRILTRQLKKVDYLCFKAQYPKLEVAYFFLEHGNALEEMVFSWDCDEAEFRDKSMDTMKELSKFHKASSTVKLVALLKKWPKECYYSLFSKV